MAVKPGQELISLGPEVSGQVIAHPAQRAVFDRIVELIEQLRTLEQPADFYEFQRRLFGLLYHVEERRGQMLQDDQAAAAWPRGSPGRPTAAT